MFVSTRSPTVSVLLAKSRTTIGALALGEDMPCKVVVEYIFTGLMWDCLEYIIRSRKHLLMGLIELLDELHYKIRNFVVSVLISS